MRKTYLYMTAVAMSAALAAGCQKAEPAETTAAAETVAESTGTGQRVSLLKPVEQRRRTMRGLRIITCFRES